MKEQEKENKAGTHQKKNDSDHSQKNVNEYAHKGKAQISKKIKELENEWNAERTLQLNASAIILTGALLGILADKRWMLLSAAAAAFLGAQAIQGWKIPVPGWRAGDEITREKYALKALKGDFKNIRKSRKAEA